MERTGVNTTDSLVELDNQLILVRRSLSVIKTCPCPPVDEAFEFIESGSHNRTATTGPGAAAIHPPDRVAMTTESV